VETNFLIFSKEGKSVEKIKNKGWQVTFAGLGINLALGILYTWSIFKLEIKESIMSGDGRFNWDLASLNDPYAVCCLVFAFTMITAGRLQDKVSPRLTAIFGGLLTGAGLLVISQSNIVANWILGFGVLMGMGLGFGYASATPPAIKWFPGRKTGMIAGIVVAGFPCFRLYSASGELPDRQVRTQPGNDDFRRGLHGCGLRLGHVSGQSSRGIQTRRRRS
jgi:MFS family permease